LRPEPIIVDARGLKCPLPVLKAEKALAQLPAGAELVVLATDPMARVDIPLFCRTERYACEVSTAGDELSFRIRR
jgi:tRNA 2-thiouridine synthesizing protein A